MKRRNGFMLIELLAVIVILAIIAVIAVPIVLNIIDESKSNATLRSADFYLDAVEMSVAQSTLKDKNIPDGTYNIKDGDICLNDGCTEILEVEVNGEVPDSGTIAITNGNITGLNIILNEKEITLNNKNEMVYVKFLDEICKPAGKQYFATNPNDLGYKYNCKVDPNKPEYTFYVLNYNDENGNITTDKTNAKSINLIMNSNINRSGEAVDKLGMDDMGNVAWISEEDYKKPELVSSIKYFNEWNIWGYANDSKGPITALNYLEEATKNWTNLNLIDVNKFNDRYGNYYDIAKGYKMYARMMYATELGDEYWDYQDQNTYPYLYSNLSILCLDSATVNLVPCEEAGVIQGVYKEGLEILGYIPKVTGYWTMTTLRECNSDYSYCDFFWMTSIVGDPSSSNSISSSEYYGVRPVITLKI